MSNVVDLPVVTRLDSNPDRLLESAKGELNDVLILGYDKDGDFYFASSKADGAEVNWLLDVAKKLLLEAGLE